jgi:fibronectin type III domain protein
MSVRRVARNAIPALLALALIAPEATAAARGSSPAAPTNLRITATTSSTATLAWDAPKSGSGIAYYQVVDKLRWGTYFTVKPPQTSFTLTRLWPNSNYSWVVRAVDTNGRASAESNTVTHRTPADTTAPSAPTLSALYVGPKLVELDWTDSVDDTSKVSYAVNVNGSSTTVGTKSYVVLPVAPSTSHSISVTSRDQWGNATTSNTLSITTPAADNTSPPTAPPNFTGFEVSNCEGWLSWNASTDDVDPPSVIGYEAYVNGKLDFVAFGHTSTMIYATQNGTNTYTVVAFDSSGNRSQPSTVDIHDMWLC